MKKTGSIFTGLWRNFWKNTCNKKSEPIFMQEINVRKVFKDKNPKLAALIPGFMFKYLEKIIHQREMNEFIRLHGQKQGIDFINAIIDFFNITIHIQGAENIEKDIKALYVSNHPLGGLDGIILIKIISENHSDVKVLVNDILMNIVNLEKFFLPINKHGSQSKDAVSAIDKYFESSTPMLTFPAGLCSRKINGKIIDLEWKKNFISKAIESERHIVPLYFKGRNSNFFYNLSNFRKKLGIKANIEMLYLADEMFKHRNGVFSITFGKIIPYTSLDKSKSHKEWAASIKEIVYTLAKDTH